MSIKEQYLIFDRGGSVYVGELGHGFKASVSIHITGWYVMDYPVKWGNIEEILVVLPVFVRNDGWHEALPVSLGKDK